jgi:hypothetical protein
MEWQPIETAPKDGSLVLLAVNDDGVWEFDLFNAHKHDFTGEGFGMSRNLCPYTHWTIVTTPNG